LGLLVCDSCGGVLAHDGSIADKAFRDSLPEDLAPHFDARGTLKGIARTSGWTSDEAEQRWSCLRCSSAPPPPATK
jgi:hypothetical protein